MLGGFLFVPCDFCQPVEVCTVTLGQKSAGIDSSIPETLLELQGVYGWIL